MIESLVLDSGVFGDDNATDSILIFIASNKNNLTTYELQSNDIYSNDSYYFYLYKFHDMDRVYIITKDMDYVKKIKYSPIKPEYLNNNLLHKDGNAYCPIVFCDESLYNFLNDHKLVVKEYIKKNSIIIMKTFEYFSNNDFEFFINFLKEEYNNRIVKKIL